MQLLGQWERLYTLLDADPAGQEAITRLTETFGFRAIPVQLPPGVKDPADLARLVDGSALFQDAICRAVDRYVEYHPGRRNPTAQGRAKQMHAGLQAVELTVVDTNTAEWGAFPIPELGVALPVMPLMDDPDTGMQVMKVIYRAGFTNIRHTHPCAHGIYVLEGTLKTHRGTFGPGNFVWFPEGGIMEHGATEERDCTFLFITNKPFGIHYPDRE